MTLSRRPRGRRHRLLRTAAHPVAVALAAAAMFTAQWAGPAASASARPRPHASASSWHRGWVKYYIVQQPRDHHQEFLYEIAVKTLGNGSLASKIFRLNEGRIQPGGGRLESPTVIEPGWILLLPANASGPGVHDGPLPVVTAPAAASATASPTASPALLAPLRPSLAAVGTVTPRSRYLLVSKHAVILGGMILIALLLAAGLVAAFRRRRKARAARKPGGGQAPAPAAGPETGKPAGSIPTAINDAGSLPWPDYLSPGVSHRSGPVAGRVFPAGGLPATPPDGTAQLTGTADGPVHKHDVAFGDDRIHVVLAGASVITQQAQPRNGDTGLTSTPYLVWTPLPHDIPEGGIAFACLGAGGDGCLFIDLGAAPGTVAIGGDGPAAVRLAESIAHQLCTAAARRCVVVVIGDALPAPPPSGAAWVASLRALGSARPAQSPDDGTEVIFCRSSPEEDMLWLARYVSGARRRVVPVVLASLPDAPWSFTAQPSRHPNESLHSVVA
jgi:hypothetical protein